MTIQTARNMMLKQIDGMSLEEIQQHKVRLIDAWRESQGAFGFDQAVRDGFFKVLASESASGYVPVDLWLTQNLSTRLDEVIAKETEMLRDF